MIFSRADFWKAVIAGELIALLALPVLKNLGFFKSWFISIWLSALPLATVFGLYVFYFVAIRKWPLLYQIGKYGIVGWLNLFVTAGVLNFLILISDIAKGLIFDVFVIISFCAGITNAFFWNKYWTFGMNDSGDGKKEYVKFFVVSGVVAIVNAGLMHLWVNVIGAPETIDPKIWVNIAFGALIPVSFFGNFFGYRLFVFKEQGK